MCRCYASLTTKSLHMTLNVFIFFIASLWKIMNQSLQHGSFFINKRSREFHLLAILPFGKSGNLVIHETTWLYMIWVTSISFHGHNNYIKGPQRASYFWQLKLLSWQPMVFSWKLSPGYSTIFFPTLLLYFTLHHSTLLYATLPNPTLFYATLLYSTLYYTLLFCIWTQYILVNIFSYISKQTTFLYNSWSDCHVNLTFVEFKTIYLFLIDTSWIFDLFTSGYALSE